MKRSAAALVASLVLGLTALGFIAAGSASGDPRQTPTTIAPIMDTRRSQGGAMSPAAMAIAAVTRSRVSASTRIRGGHADYVEFDLRQDGTGFVVTLFRTFDEGELSHLEQIMTATGTAWIGAEDPDLVSIYFRDGVTGTAVWVSFSGAAEVLPSRTRLEQVASKISSAPEVVQEAAS